MNNSIPIIGILTLVKHDLLTRLINSIDYKVDTVVILFQHGYNNFDFSKIKNNFINKFIFIASSFNIGVSRGWNYILENYLKTYCIISGDDNYFIPGNLEKVAKFMTDDKLNDIMFTFNEHISFSTYIFTKKALETVGYFDENIYPAYFEDNDYHYRIKLSGNDFIQIPGVDILSGDNNTKHSCTLNSVNNEYRNKMGECYLRNESYFKSKWNDSTSIYPFNRSDLTIKTKINHKNFFENQKILLGHTDTPIFSKTEILTEDLIKFDYIYYKENNRDLVNFNENRLLYHYIEFGLNELRDSYENETYNRFNFEEYINNNFEELKNKGIDTKEKAWIHFRIFNKKDLISFENILSIKYGIDIYNSIELKNVISEYFTKNKTTILNKNINLNNINYDPYPNIYKYLYIIYNENNEIKLSKHNEIRNIDIYITFQNI